MTAEVQTAAPTDSVHDLMKLMTEHRIRHVPVFADDELHGIVSIGDVVKSRIGELEFERDQLDVVRLRHPVTRRSRSRARRDHQPRFRQARPPTRVEG